MKKLTAIYNKLSPWELTQLTNQYKQEGKRESSLRLKLLEIIEKNPQITAKEAAQKIYNKEPDAAFSNLKRRLLEDILNILVIQNSESLFPNKLAQIKHSCRKKILSAEILIMRGEHEIGCKILENTLKITEEYELLNESISIRLKLANSKGARQGLETINFYFEDIEADLQALQNLVCVEKTYRQVSLSNKFKISKKKETEGILEKQISQLNNLEIKKDRIAATYYQTLVYYYYEKKDFKAYLEIIKKYEELVLPGKILHSNSNLAWAYDSMTEVYINTAQYDKAIEFAQKTLKLLNKNKSNRVFALRTTFIAYFNKQEYTKATETIQEAYQERLVKSNVLEKARFDFFAACVAFQEGKMDVARDQLQKASKIANKDSTGWLIGYKILEMMIAIVCKDYYLLSIQLNSFIKLINNHKEAQTDRAKLIYKILRNYNKLNFDKKSTMLKINNEFQLLETGKDEYYWDPISYEPIRFDKWFLGL